LNKDIIHNAIENPELSLGKGVDDLEKISSQYPYFGAAQLLLTKAYQRSNGLPKPTSVPTTIVIPTNCIRQLFIQQTENIFMIG